VWAEYNVSDPIFASDGQLLSVKLKKVEAHRRRTAFFLVLPLLLFISVTYLFPIGQLLVQSVDNRELFRFLSHTNAVIHQWEGEQLPDEAVYLAFYKDLSAAVDNKQHGKIATRLNYEKSGFSSLIKKTSRKIKTFEAGNYRIQFIKADKRWENIEYMLALQKAAVPFHGRKYLTAFDLDQNAAGEIVQIPENRRINVILWLRTIMVALGVTLSCLILAFPIAYMLATMRAKYSNLLMICVLLPFWTSLLVRTSSWMVLLQKQGLINDILVFLDIVPDENRLALMYNMLGTFIAMTQILLPFMVLPLYSVMKTISPNLMQAATSMGSTPLNAFRRIYLPLTYSGISAGSILVFVLAIGYYITPALVGGAKGALISNRIAYHMNSSLDWALATAMGTVLLATVLCAYWAYNRVVGIDNMRLG
jgi:putative spermidine/putrescine transport system permease protein